MRGLLFFAGVILTLAPLSARADRVVTDAERSKLLPAIAAAGCSGGEIKFDDGKYEVDDATCGDGRYDLEFDAGFQLMKKDQED